MAEQTKQRVLSVGRGAETQPKLKEATPELATVLRAAHPHTVALEEALHPITEGAPLPDAQVLADPAQGRLVSGPRLVELD